MARKAFFSFHFKNDSWRVGQVRNSWLTQKDSEASKFLDKADWEKVEKDGPAEIKKWIDAQLTGTSVTVVLIGSKTYDREWVKYEIEKSIKEKKGLLGVYIHNVKDSKGVTESKGKNPFDKHKMKNSTGTDVGADTLIKTYDWVSDDGRTNLPKWIEAAAKQAGR